MFTHLPTLDIYWMMNHASKAKELDRSMRSEKKCFKIKTEKRSKTFTKHVCDAKKLLPNFKRLALRTLLFAQWLVDIFDGQ